MQGLGPVRHALVSSFACAAACTASPCLSGNTERAWDVTNTGQPYRDITFTTTEGTWMSVDISPDGKSLVFDLLGSIYQIPSTGGDAKLIHGGPAMQRTPSFSPDGRKLLYISDASGAENAWMSNPDGSDAQQITHETANLLMSIAWAGDGESVVGEYIEGRYPARFTSDLRLFDLLGGVRTIVPTPPNRRDVAEPALSRDGRYIYYTERLAPTFQIYVDANHINYAVKRSDLQTGAVEEMASSWGGGFDPQISRDGRRLAFVRRVENKTVLFVLELATNEQRAIYDGLDRDLQASTIRILAGFPTIGTLRSGARAGCTGWTWTAAGRRRSRSVSPYISGSPTRSELSMTWSPINSRCERYVASRHRRTGTP